VSVRIVTPPSSEPVTLAEAKAHLRLEESRDDAYVSACITAARQYIEQVCWRALLQQTWRLECGAFRGADKREQIPSYVGGVQYGSGLATSYPIDASRFEPFIELPRGHLADVPNIAVTYLDAAGVVQTLAPAAYVVESFDNRPGRLWLNRAGGYSWPDTLDRFDAVRVTYTVGWASAAQVPAPLRQSVLLLVSQMYEFRTPQVTGAVVSTLEFAIDALTAPYRMVRL
jgi:hypothetical protein